MLGGIAAPQTRTFSNISVFKHYLDFYFLFPHHWQSLFPISQLQLCFHARWEFEFANLTGAFYAGIRDAT